MVQEKVVSISTNVALDSASSLHPFLWEVVDGIVSPDADGGFNSSSPTRTGGTVTRTGGATRTGTTRGTTTTSVAPSGGGSSSTITLPSTQIYVDLYPDRGDINVFSTSGTLSNPQSFVVTKTEIIVFSNTDRVGLRYGDIGNVSITLLGSFLDVNGNVINPSFTVNGGTFEMVSSVIGYGAIKVTYTTSKKRYLFEFVGSCPATIPVDSEGNKEEVFEQATLLALWQNGGELRNTTIDITNSNSRCVNSGSGNISVIYPDDTPVGFQLIDEGATGSLGSGTNAVNRIKVFPSGLITADNISASNATFSVSDSSLQDEFVNDSLSFQNTFQQNMSRVIINGLGLSVAASGDIVDQFGDTVSVPRFAGPGEIVEEVEWTTSVTFKATGRRFEVPIGIIISVTSGNKTLPITGTVTVSYTAPYDLVFLERLKVFDVSSDTSSGKVRNQAVARQTSLSIVSELNGSEISGTISIPEYNGGNNGRS